MTNISAISIKRARLHTTDHVSRRLALEWRVL